MCDGGLGVDAACRLLPLAAVSSSALGRGTPKYGRFLTNLMALIGIAEPMKKDDPVGPRVSSSQSS